MSTTEGNDTHDRGTDDGMAEFGYTQSLERSIGKFASFAAGISYISILTGTFQLFYFGFAFGGAAYWWSWPLVFAGQLTVADVDQGQAHQHLQDEEKGGDEVEEPRSGLADISRHRGKHCTGSDDISPHRLTLQPLSKP